MKKICLYFGFGLFLAACATSPTGRKQFILVSDGEMNQMGYQAFNEMKTKTPIEYNSKINAYVKCVAQTITQEAQDQTGVKNWEVIVFRDPSANAFALPGGKIGVHTGILSIASSADQLAAILGHEVGHVISRHGAERVSQSTATQSGLSLADAMLDTQNTNRNLILAGLGVGAQLGVILPFSRKHESEADEIGLYLMANAGFNPEESIELWRNMAKAGSSSTPEFMSTHPTNSTRISKLQSNMPKAKSLFKKAQSAGKYPNCGSI